MEERGGQYGDTSAGMKIPSHARGRIRISWLWIYVIIAGIVALSAITFFSGLWEVQYIEWRRSGGEDDVLFAPSLELKTAVESLLSEKKFFFLPKNNFFLISVTDIQKRLTVFPSYRVSTVTRQFPDTVVIYIEPKLRFSYIIQEYMEQRVIESIQSTPSASELSDTTVAQASEAGVTTQQITEEVSELPAPQFVKVQKYFRVSGQGALGEEISRNDVSGERPVMRILTSRPLVIGEQVVPQQIWDFMSHVNDIFEHSTTIPIEAFEIGEELLSSEVRVVTTEGWTVALDTFHDLSDQMTRLELLLKHEIKETRPTLRSIDLRIQGKAFYQ